MRSQGVEQYLDPNGTLAALVIRGSYSPEGIEFLTPLSQTQQLGIMRRPAGYQVEPHVHTRQLREIQDTNEVLFVRSGELSVTLYDSSHAPYCTFTVGPMDAVLLAAGGHGVTFLTESEVLEVKQGPYTEVADKSRFEPAE